MNTPLGFLESYMFVLKGMMTPPHETGVEGIPSFKGRDSLKPDLIQICLKPGLGGCRAEGLFCHDIKRHVGKQSAFKLPNSSAGDAA